MNESGLKLTNSEYEKIIHVINIQLWCKDDVWMLFLDPHKSHIGTFIKS